MTSKELTLTHVFSALPSDASDVLLSWKIWPVIEVREWKDNII